MDRMFFRYESFRQYLRLYPLTSMILAANLIVYLLMLLTGQPKDTDTLIRFGAMVNEPPYRNEYWRYFTSMFVHIGFEHLLFNGFALFVFTPPMERIAGRLRYLILYLGSGLAGNLATVLLSPDPFVSAGASGAIYGIFGAFLYLILLRKDLFDQSARTTVYSMLGLGLVYSLAVPGVNFYAHAGGFAGGFLLLHILMHASRRS
jgi:membrane associated rhomboid family serine protease